MDQKIKFLIFDLYDEENNAKVEADIHKILIDGWTIKLSCAVGSTGNSRKTGILLILEKQK
jgi:hypothetical protein